MVTRRRIKQILIASGLMLCCVFGGYFIITYNTQVSAPVLTEYRSSADDEWIRNFFRDNWYWLVSEYSTDFSLDYILSHKVSSTHPEQARPLSIFMLYQKKAPVGFVAYFRESSDVGKILFVGVDKQWRGAGYAKLLLDHAAHMLCSQGCRFVDLVTRTQNLSAQAAYKKYGFYVTSEENGFVYFRYNCK